MPTALRLKRGKEQVGAARRVARRMKIVRMDVGLVRESIVVVERGCICEMVFLL